MLGLALGLTLDGVSMSSRAAKLGTVVVFDGSSSAGKSSVITQLIPLLNSSYERIAVDDFVTEVFLEQRTLNLSEKDFTDRVHLQVGVMYDKIRELDRVKIFF